MDIGYDVLVPVINLIKQYLNAGFTIFGIYVTIQGFFLFSAVACILLMIIKTLGVVSGFNKKD